MGDHRAEIHATFKIHGKTYKLDLDWINYFDAGDGVDRRVTEFFRDSWEDARGRWQEEVDEYHRKARAKETEAEERKQLEELKAKYG